MRIFINDIPIKITDKPVINHTFNTVINKNAGEISIKELKGNVLITTSNIEAIDRMLKIMTDKKYRNITGMIIQVDDKLNSIQYLKSKFTIVEAAGGLVEKDDQLLFIHRRGVWDLPKGKLDKGEKKKHAALREVEEETGVKAELQQKVCATWHTYTRNKKFVLKKTYWYAMNCLDDSNMQPQEDEDIDRVKWMSQDKADKAAKKSFASIAWVVNKYYSARTPLNSTL